MKRNLLFCFLFLFTVQLYAADYYWVGGGGNWSDLNHWRLGSSTGSIPSIVPAAGDNVIFGPNAGFGTTPATRTVVINANAFCNNMIWESGVPNNPILSALASNKINIYGNLTLAPTVTYTTVGINFLGTSNAVLTTNGVIGGTMSLTVNKSGSELTLADDLIYTAINTATNTLDVLAGRLNAQAKQLTLYSLVSNNSNTRSLDFRNAILNVSIAVDIRGTNKAFDATGSVVTTARLYVDGGSFHNVNVGTASSSYVAINNTTFGKLTFTNTSPGSTARIHSNNIVDSLFFKGSGSIREGTNKVNHVVFDGDATIGGSGNIIRYAELHGKLDIINQGNNVFDTLFTAPNKNILITGTNTINKYFRAGGLPCDGFTEISGAGSGTLNFASGAKIEMDNVQLTNLAATGPNIPIIVNGIDNEGNSGFNIIEPTGPGQTLYWVGGAGDWNDKAHWSTTSGGSGGACIPFINDDVVFDGGSGFVGGNSTVTTSANSYCNNMTWASGISGSPIFKTNTSFILRVYGSVVLNPSVTMDATIELPGTKSVTLTTNGSTLGTNRYIIRKSDVDATSGLTLTDNWNNTKGRFDLVRGVLDLNDRKLTISEFVSNSSSGRNLKINNADITIYNWTYTGSFKSMSSTGSRILVTNGVLIRDMEYNIVECSATHSSFDIRSATFDQLTFSNPSLISGARIGDGNTIKRLEFKGQGMIRYGGNVIESLITAENRNFYFYEGTNTITKYFKATHPSCTGLGEIRTGGATSTIIFGADAEVDIANVYMENIAATGGGGTLQLPIAFNGADAGGNSGWNISTGGGNARYWIGGGGDWNDASHWSETSGGAGGACIPTVNDDVYFDGNSGFGTTVATRTVTVDNGNAYFHNMSWAGASNNPILTKAAAWAMESWGDALVLNPTVTLNISALQLKGSKATVLSGQTLGNFDLDIKKPGGSLTIANDYLNKSTDISLYEGSFIAVGRTLDIASIDNNSRSATMSVNIEGSIINGDWRFNGPVANHTLLADNSVINSTGFFLVEGLSYNVVNYNNGVSQTPVGSKLIDFNNTSINRLVFTNTSTTSTAGINGSNNKLGTVEYKGSGVINGTGNEIGTLIFFPGSTYTLTNGATAIITGEWFGSGTPCKPTEIKTNGSATFTKTSGSVDFDYVRLQNIVAAGGATFTAREHSTNLGGNTGWDIVPYNGASPILGLGPDLALNLSQFPYTLTTDGFFGSPLSQYVWSKDGNVIGSGNQLVITEPGTYKVDVTFPDGCTISDEIVVSQEAADLSIAKTVDYQTPDVGSNVVFKLVVTNEGPGEGTDISVEDLLPAGYAYVSSNAEAGTVYDPATGIWTVGTLAIGESSALTITATVNATGSYENTATVTASEVDPVPENNSSTVTPVPVPVADLSVVKTIDNLSPYAGNNVDFSIEVSNQGPSDATGVSVKDLLPSGYAFVSAIASSGSYNSGTGVWTVGNLANGGNATLTITATVNTTGVYENTAEVSGDQADRAAANNLSTITPTPIIVQINKTGPSTANAGTEITYVLSVTNTGTGDAIGQLIEDVVPELTDVKWEATALGSASISNGATGTGNDISVIADIPVGGGNQITVRVTGRVPASSTATSLSNTATVSATGSPDFGSNTVVTALTKQADLRIQKTGPSTVVAGSEVVYTLEVTNAGPSDAKNVTITDMMPVGLNSVTWTATAQNGAVIDKASGADDVIIPADIPAGTGSVLVTIKGILDAGYAGASLVNTATAIPETGVTDPTPATATVTSTVSRSANIRITKSGPANIGAGEDIRYTLRVVNDGPSSANGVEIKDVLPSQIENVSWTSTVQSGTSINGSDSGNGDIDLTGNLPSGGIIEIEITGKVNAGATDGSSFTNTATANLPVGSSVTDPDLTSNTSTVTTLVSNTPNFTVSKSGPSTVNIGDPIQYTIVVRNSGLGNITGAQIKDEVPSSVIVTNWNIVGAGGANVTGTASGTGNSINRTGDIPVGGLLTVNISGIVGKTTGLQIVNTVTVTAGDVISSDVTSAVNQSTDVIVEKSGPQSAAAGLPITYTVKVSNAGPIDAEDLTIKDNVPIEVESISWSATVVGSASIRGTSSGDTNAIEVNANIDAGAGNYILITVKGIVNAGTNAATITNTASVALPSGTLTDFNPINNASTVETIIVKETDLSITKVVDYTSPMVGSNVVFTLVAMNKGPSVATGVKVTDLLPAGYKFVSSVPAADYDEATGKWTIGTLANGASETLTITAIVNASGPYENVATIIGLEADPDLANNTTSAITTPIPQAHLITVKELKDGMQSHFVPGDVVLYTIRVENQGPSAAENVNIKDIAPLGTQISAWRAIPSAGVIYPNASGTGNLNETLSVLANGDAAVYEVEVKTPSNFASALVNTVSVSSTTKDSNPGACVACTTPPLPSVGKADIVTVKTLKDPAQTTFVPGEEVVYNISVTNNGPSDAQVVNIKDSAPTGTTINGWTATVTSGTVTLPNTSGTGNLDETITVLPNGAVVGYEVRVKTSSGFIGDLVNLASATSVTDDPDPTCADCETAPITAAPIADLVTVKTTTDVTQTSFVPGETVVYGIRVTNNGPSDARNVNIKDVAPTGTVISGWTAKVISGTVLLPNLSGAGNLDETIATLPNGAMVSYEVMVQTPANFAGALSNTAAVTSSTDDPNPICTTCTTTPLTAVANADLVTVKTTKDLTQTTFVPGEEVVYTITVTNDGPSDAQDVNIKDSAPIGTAISGWTARVVSGTVTLPNASGTGDLDETIATLPNGAAVSYEVTVETAASFNSDLVNLVTVSSSTDDPDPSCSDCETTPLSATPIADLVTVKTTKDLTQTTFVPGEEVVYIITVTNDGPSDAQQVNIKDSAPTGTTISGWTATVVSGTVALPNTSGTGDLDETIATLPNGAAVSYEVRVKTPADFTVDLVNTVSVISGTDDPDPSCPDCETTPLSATPFADLVTVKTTKDLAQTTFVPGEEVVYTITVTNNGPSDAQQVNIKDAAPTGTTISGWTATGVSGTVALPNTNGTGDLDQTIATLPNGAAVSYEVRVKTPAGFTGNLSNIVMVTSGTYDPDPVCTACQTVPLTPLVIPEADSRLELWKTGTYHDLNSNGIVDVGDVVNYGFTVRNTGNTPIDGIRLDDPMVPVSGGPISLAAGDSDSGTFTAVYAITQADIDKGSVYNRAIAKGKDPSGKDVTIGSRDPDPLDPKDPATITLLKARGQIALLKTVINAGTGNGGAFLLGDEIQYRFVITNMGNTTLSDIVLSDPLISSVPALLPGSLPPGASVAHTAVYKVSPEDADKGHVLNQATVTAKDPKGTAVESISGSAPGNNYPTLTPISHVPPISDVPPMADDDRSETEAGKTVIIRVLENDRPGSSAIDPSSIEIIDRPLHGTLVVNPDGTIGYTPDEGYIGDDTFTYRIKDANGNWSNVAKVATTTRAGDFFIPNVFTPNGDGRYDTFAILGLEGYDSADLTIFNRWGNEVYRSKVYRNNWDGSNLNEGTYYYMLVLKKGGKETVRKGWVLLKR